MKSLREIIVTLKLPHAKQELFINSMAKRKIVKAGRRGGKTVGAAIFSIKKFLSGKRVLYTAPTQEQVNKYWSEINLALSNPIKQGLFKRNIAEHFIELSGTEQRIKAKTAWNADSLRGDYADVLILDEFQLMNEDTWGLVGAPMLLDNDGDAIFIYTPPSLHSRSISKANDPQHAAKMYRKAVEEQKNGSKRWEAFHFTSLENPYISKDALNEITSDMSFMAYQMEIMAEDLDEAPGALWTRKTIDNYRIIRQTEDFDRVVVSVDPSATSTGDEAGVVVCGRANKHGYVVADKSIQGSPLIWAKEAVNAYHEYKADKIIAESNNGGEMVELTIHQVDKNVPVKLIHASRGKQTRAEPISVLAEKGKIHHIGNFIKLEEELCLWTPGDKSPNRLDAMVHGMTELLVKAGVGFDWSSFVDGDA